MAEQTSGTAEPDSIPGNAATGARPTPESADLPVDPPADPPAAGEQSGRRWSLPGQLVLAGVGALLISATLWHLGTIFLSIAPSNTVSKSYAAQIDAHVYPEFEQNWQLFAPNPLQDNIAVEVRVQTLAPGGATAESGWIDLTAQDIAAIRGNPAPSHVNQNLLRRAWDYYTSWHQSDGTPIAPGGAMSQTYLERIGLQRLGRDWHGNPISELQFRTATTPISGPAWTGAAATSKTTYAVLGWWVVTPDDYQGLGK